MPKRVIIKNALECENLSVKHFDESFLYNAIMCELNEWFESEVS